MLIGKTQAIEHPKTSVVSDSEEIAQRLAGPKVKGTVMALNAYKWYKDDESPTSCRMSYVHL